MKRHIIKTQFGYVRKIKREKVFYTNNIEQARLYCSDHMAKVVMANFNKMFLDNEPSIIPIELSIEKIG